MAIAMAMAMASQQSLMEKQCHPWIHMHPSYNDHHAALPAATNNVTHCQ